MESWYEEDIGGIPIKDKEYWKSIELSHGIIIDISRMEILSALKYAMHAKFFLEMLKK